MRDRNVMRYSVVTHENAWELAKVVDEMVGQAWQPYGPVVVGMAYQGQEYGPDKIFAQTMVQYS